MGLGLKRDVLMGNWANIMSSSKVVTMSLPLVGGSRFLVLIDLERPWANLTQ